MRYRLKQRCATIYRLGYIGTSVNFLPLVQLLPWQPLRISKMTKIVISCLVHWVHFMWCYRW